MPNKIINRIQSAKKLLDNAIEELTEPTKSCTWERSGLENAWETDCSNMYNIFDGSPLENNMKFCCFCGLPIKEK